MGLFDSIKKFVDNIFGAIGDVLGYVLGIDTDLEDKYKGQLINKSSNIQKIPVIYGERLVGGTRVFVSTGGGKKNQYLYIALVLSEGEVDSIGDIYINDIISTDSRFTNKATIYKYRGTDNQAATTLFADADESWTSAHQLKGVAYLAMRFKYDQDVFTSIPEIRAVVKGKKVYNPATQTTEWSDNPALCLRDYLTNSRYGKGLPASAIDDASIIQAANDCDSLVTPYGGATDIPLFKFNAIIDTGETVFDNVKKIIASMRGILPYSNGQYSLLVDKNQSSTFTLTEDNILSDIKIVSSSKENKFNQVTAKFPNPAKRWELDTVTYPDSGSTEETAFLNEDNQQILSKEITLHNVTNAYRAKDLARIACLASRRQSLTVSITCTSEALNIAVGDIVTIEHDSLGWTGAAVQEFRVMGMVLDDSGEVDLTLQQYDASIYPWVEQSEIPDNPETTLPDPFTTAPVTNQSGTGQAVVQNDGTVTYFYDLEWDEPDDALVEYYLIDVNKTIDEVETLAAETLQTQNLSFRYMVSDTSIDYGFTIRAVNGAGTRSAGVTIPASSVIKDTTPPSVIDAQTTSVVAGLQSITVSWENPTEEDFDLVRIKVNDTNTEPTSHFAATRSDTFIHDIGEYSTIKYYWIAPVDTSGNVADYTFAGSATTGSIDYGDVLNPPTIPEVATTVYLTLGDNNAPTTTEFNTAVGRDPIENDFVVVNKEFAFVYDGSTWSAVTEFIDGSLLVSGSISADDITTGTLNANDVTISNLTVSYDDLGDKPDLSEFITAGEVNDNVTVINGGIIQAGTAITVGTGDDVSILSGADTTYRLWAGDLTASDAPFSVTKEGVLNATGAIIDGDITATSIDVENATVTGTFIAPIGWGNSVYNGVINRENLSESVKDLIDERIAEVTGGIEGDFGQDDGGFSYIAQGNPLPDHPLVSNITHENGKNLTIELSGNRSWTRTFVGLPDVDMGVSITIQRASAGSGSWTNLVTLTDSGSSITTSTYLVHSGTQGYSISIYHVISEDPASGNYDYRAYVNSAESAYSVTVPLELTVVEPATVGAGNADTLDNQDGTYYLDYNNFTNTPTIPDVSGKADLSGDTFTGFITLSAGSGLYQYTENGAYINWDTRDSSLGGSATAMVHKWANKADDSGYATYYENWWDGDSYHSIGVDGGRWKLSDGIDVNGTITASGYNNSNWDTAYSWGNHASAGYLTAGSSYDLTGDIRVTSGSLSFYGDVHMGFIPYPNGGQFRSDSGSLTGYVKIALPDGVDSSDDMISFWVDIFDYTTSESVSLFIGGYNYQSTGNYWVNCTAQVFTKSASKDYTVRFGFDGSRKFVTIGEPTSTWSHPSVVVRDFQTSFRGNVTHYRDDWVITTSTSAFSGVDEVQTGNLPQSSSAKKWTTARTLSLTGDVTGSVSIDGSANASITTVVANDSHTHDGRYYTEAESDDRFARVHKGTATINTSYTTVATISGDRLASSIDMTIQGTSGNVVINVDAKILVNHSQDILIKTESGIYTQIQIKVTSNNNESYAIEVARVGGSGDTGVAIEIFPRNSETVTFTSSHSFTGSSLNHQTYVGTKQTATGGGAYHLVTDGNISSQTYEINGTTVIDSSRTFIGNDGYFSGDVHVNSGSSGNDYLRLYKTASGDGGILFLTDNAINWQNVQTSTGLNWYSYSDGSTVVSIKNDGTLTTKRGYQVNGTTVIDSSRNFYASNLYATRPVFNSESSSDDALVSRWRYADSDSYQLNIHQRVTSGVVRWSFGQVNASTTYSDLFVLDRGRVGFGIQNPEKQVHIYGGGNEPLYLQGTSAGVWMNIKSNLSELWSMGADSSGWGIYNRSQARYHLTVGNSGTNIRYGGLQVNGTTVIDSSRNTAFAICNANSFAGGAGKIFYPSGAEYQTSASSVSGAIKIRLPDLRSNTMMRMTVKVYEYAGGDNGSSFTIELGGYNYSNGGWYNVFANVIGDTSQSLGYNVRFGEEGGYNCIWISEPTDSWAYPQVFVTEFQGGYSKYESSRWDDNWDITFATTLGSVYKIITANQIGRVCKSNFTASGNVTAYSDITLKDNITNIDNALDKVNSIRGVTYDRIDQDNVRHAGVIAQEVEKVLPEVVQTNDNGIKSVAYGNMVGLLIEAIKELKAEIEELKK